MPKVLLETPDQTIRAYVLFAHCFTCGKDVAVAARISRFLVQYGFAVFRFDFIEYYIIALKY